MTNNTIKSVLQEAQKKLISISDSPALDAEILLSYCLEKERIYLHTWPENRVEQESLNCFHRLIEKRLTDYPIAYLVGTKAFWTLDLIVTPDVLIPRPETELLVETALEKVKNIENPKILDLGTGSGAIALALASERADARIIATDASAKALHIAKKNADKYQLNGIVEFIESDWFSNIVDKDFDLIVSNPPYIVKDDSHLLTTIRHEPQQALVADNDGMSDIEIIIKNSPAYLKHEGWLMIEHGFEQENKIQKIMRNYHYNIINTLTDLSGNPRLALSQRKHSI